MNLDDLVVSCCANPEKDLEAVLRDYSALGYTRLECFCDWVASALDVIRDPAFYLDLARSHGMSFYALHLPHFDESRLEESLNKAVDATRFAAALGMTTVYPRATSREAWVRAGKPFLDAIAETGLTAAIEIHKGFPVDNCASLREVLEDIGDVRMKAVLEMGHLHHAGESWREAWEQFGERLAVVHLKDIKDGANVALGAGEVGVGEMIGHLEAVGFEGDYVVELLVDDRENTPRYLAEARQFVQNRGA